MKLSTRARYALRAMIVIARETTDGTPINLAEVAKKTSLSRRYLEQVSISLKNEGLLKAVSGKNGGHLLARPADQIRLGEIVEATIGPINIVECVRSPSECIRVGVCECRDIYLLINQRIKEAFDAFTLSDLANNRVGAAVSLELNNDGAEPAAGAAKKYRDGRKKSNERKVTACGKFTDSGKKGQ